MSKDKAKGSVNGSLDWVPEASVLKGIGHPVRVKALALLCEGKDTKASPNELSIALGEPLGNVSYHVRALLDANLIELKNTVPRRGAIEHYYSVTDAGRAGLDAAKVLGAAAPKPATKAKAKAPAKGSQAKAGKARQAKATKAPTPKPGEPLPAKPKTPTDARPVEAAASDPKTPEPATK